MILLAYARSMDYPWARGEFGPKNNYFYVDGRRINLSFIFVANQSKETNQWSEIQKAVEKFGHTYAPAGKTQ